PAVPPAVAMESGLAPSVRPGTAADLSVLQTRRNVLVLALELHAGGERHSLQQRGEVLLQILLGVGLESGRAEMGLQHLTRGRRDRHRHVTFAAEREAEVEILAKQLGRERR